MTHTDNDNYKLFALNAFKKKKVHDINRLSAFVIFIDP